MDDLISRTRAIDALIACKGKDPFNRYEKQNIGLDWGIEALKQLPSVQPETHEERTETHACDCISRKAAIDALHGYFDGMLETDTWSPCDIYGLIEILPSAHPDLEEAYICGETEAEARYHAQQRWIPCSERLPDQYGNYLISIDGEEPDIGTINPNDPRGWSLCDANGFYWASDKALNITAWMPLPEPYAERRTDG